MKKLFVLSLAALIAFALNVMAGAGEKMVTPPEVQQVAPVVPQPVTCEKKIEPHPMSVYRVRPINVRHSMYLDHKNRTGYSTYVDRWIRAKFSTIEPDAKGWHVPMTKEEARAVGKIIDCTCPSHWDRRPCTCMVCGRCPQR